MSTKFLSVLQKGNIPKKEYISFWAYSILSKLWKDHTPKRKPILSTFQKGHIQNEHVLNRTHSKKEHVLERAHSNKSRFHFEHILKRAHSKKETFQKELILLTIYNPCYLIWPIIKPWIGIPISRTQAKEKRCTQQLG